jgi:hypothetical protein
MIWAWDRSINQPPAQENPIYALKYCNDVIRSGADKVPQENRFRRISGGTCFILVSDIRPDSFYGLTPIVPFQLWAEIRALNRILAPHQAKPGSFSGGVTSIKEPPISGFAWPGFKPASRAAS